MWFPLLLMFSLFWSNSFKLKQYIFIKTHILLQSCVFRVFLLCRSLLREREGERGCVSWGQKNTLQLPAVNTCSTWNLTCATDNGKRHSFKVRLDPRMTTRAGMVEAGTSLELNSSSIILNMTELLLQQWASYVSLLNARLYCAIYSSGTCGSAKHKELFSGF